MQNFILYLAYNDEGYINQCRYALLKYLSLYNLKPPAETGVIISTDQPALFEAYSSFFSFFKMNTGAVISDKQPVTAKLKLDVIKNVMNSYQGNFLYCDTSTYIVKPPELMFENIKNGIIYCDLIGKKSKNIQTPHIIGLNSDHYKNFIADSASLTGILDSFTSQMPVQSSYEYIYSYSMFTEFTELLNIFFKINEEESIPNLIKLINHVDVENIKNQKNLYQQLPVYKKLLNALTGKRWSIKNYQNKF